MKLSILLVTYKRGDILNQCLQSIYSQINLPRPYEIIIIDNGDDASIVYPQDPDIQVRLERPGENLWATGGRNLAIQLAQGDYLIFADDDAVWHQNDDVARIVAHLENDPRCGAVAVQPLSPDGKTIVGSLPHPNKDVLLSATAPLEVPYFYSMGAGIRADVAKKIGGYPERYKIYSEEFDLSYQVIDHGYHILYDPSIAIIHYKASAGRTLRKSNKWKQLSLNKIQVAWRLLPQPYPLTTTLMWSLYTLAKTRSPGMVLSLWRDLWKLRGTLAQERKPLRPERVRYIQRIGGRLTY